MKRVIYKILITLVFVLLMGCGNKAKNEEQANYVVVEAPKDTEVDDLFGFDSVSRIMMSDVRESSGNGSCYCIGVLPEGKSVVWEADGHLFLYVEDEVSDTEGMSYAAKLKEPGISYDSFKEKYK